VTDYNIYTAALFACGVASAALSIWVLKVNSSNLSTRERIPRNKTAGTILALLCLLWCIPHAKPIVWDWMLPWLYPLVVACTMLAYFFLDYLFSRAIGGLFILLAYYFLHESFTFHTPSAPTLVILSWIMGITGLFFSAKPHLCRDLIRKFAVARNYKYATTGYLIILSLFCLTAGVMQALRK